MVKPRWEIEPKYISFTCWGSCRYGGIPEIFGCLSSAGKVFDSIAELKSWRKDRQRRDAPSKRRPSLGILITRFVFTVHRLQFGILHRRIDRFTMIWRSGRMFGSIRKNYQYTRVLAWFLWETSSWSIYPQISTNSVFRFITKNEIEDLVSCPLSKAWHPCWEVKSNSTKVPRPCLSTCKQTWFKIYFFSRLASASHLAMEY